MNDIEYKYRDAGKPLAQELSIHLRRSESVTLLGYQGCGKRHVIHDLRRMLDQENAPYFSVFFRDGDILDFEPALLIALKERAAESKNLNLLPRLNEATSVAHWFSILCEHSQPRPLPVFFANTGLIADGLHQGFFGELQKAAHEEQAGRRIAACVTSESIVGRTMANETSPFRCTYQFVIGGYDRESAKAFWDKRVAAMGLRFADGENPLWDSTSAFERFFDQTNGNVNLLRAFLWWFSERRFRFDDNQPEMPLCESVEKKALESYLTTPLYGLKPFKTAVEMILQERDALSRLETMLEKIYQSGRSDEENFTAAMSASIKVKSQEPEVLELMGVFRRTALQTVKFASACLARFILGYFHRRCLGDFRARTGHWEKAFDWYRKASDQSQYWFRPTSERDFRVVRPICDRLSRELSERAGRGDKPEEIQEFFRDAVEWILGIKSVYFVRVREQNTWEPYGPKCSQNDEKFSSDWMQQFKAIPEPESYKRPETILAFKNEQRNRILIQPSANHRSVPPFHGVIFSAPPSCTFEKLRLRVLETLASSYLKAYTEARLRMRAFRSRLRLGNTLKVLFSEQTIRGTVEALGGYLRDEFSAKAVRLFLLQRGNPNCYESVKSWGFDDPALSASFDAGGIKVDRSEYSELWLALSLARPVAFRYVPIGVPIPEQVSELEFRGITYNPFAALLERKPGDYWIDFPLFIGSTLYGKLTLAFPSHTPPQETFIGDLQVISDIVSAHLGRLNEVRIQTQKHREMQQRAVSLAAHNLAGRVATFPSHLSRYRKLEPKLPDAVREELIGINDRFQQSFDYAIATLEHAKQRLKEVKPKFARVDIAALLRNELEAISMDGGTIQTNLGESEVWIEADQANLAAVFAELVENAKTMQEDGKAIVINAMLSIDATKNSAMVTIEDNGPGIPQEVQGCLFEYLVSHRPNQKRRGLGLGLSFVRESILAHGGNIEHFAPTSGGAGFRITLPIKQTDNL